MICLRTLSLFFFFNDTATTEIYTLSLHDALPISRLPGEIQGLVGWDMQTVQVGPDNWEKITPTDRKSTRLNSSHLVISYAVFCLKKKKGLEEQIGYPEKIKIATWRSISERIQPHN